MVRCPPGRSQLAIWTSNTCWCKLVSVSRCCLTSLHTAHLNMTGCFLQQVLQCQKGLLVQPKLLLGNCLSKESLDCPAGVSRIRRQPGQATKDWPLIAAPRIQSQSCIRILHCMIPVLNFKASLCPVTESDRELSLTECYSLAVVVTCSVPVTSFESRVAFLFELIGVHDDCSPTDLI